MKSAAGPCDFEIAIIGGGPAGLSAAIAGGRLNRRTVCFETGTPRTAQAPQYLNVLGFVEGISGKELLERGRRQARQWCTELRDAKVTSIERISDADTDLFRLETSLGHFQAQGVIFATGMEDVQPSCGNLYGKPGVHYCVVCDGYEVRGQRVAIIGNAEGAFRMVCALRDFTDDLHLLLDGRPLRLPPGDIALLEAWGVRVVGGRLCRFECPAGESKLFIHGERDDCRGELEEGYPHIFVALGCRPRTALAERLGCQLDERGFIATDPDQATTVAFVYAAGDCDGGYKQVTQAIAEGERAALELARKLREAAGPALGAAEPNPAGLEERSSEEFEVERMEAGRAAQ